MIKNKVILLVIVSFIFISTCILAENGLEGFQLVASNDYLLLYLNSENTGIAVKDKYSGQIWYTNPPDWKQKERLARGNTRKKLNAQLEISFYDQERILYMDSYNDSVVYNQYEIKKNEEGIKINYTLGKKWDDEAYLPEILSEKHFNEMLNMIKDENDKEFVRGNYDLIYLKEVPEDYERYTVFGIDQEEFFGNNTLFSPDEEIEDKEEEADFINYYLGLIIENREDREGKDQLKVEDISYLRNNPAYIIKPQLFPWDVEDMIKLFKEVGFTPEMVRAAYQEVKLDPPQPNEKVFTIPLEYKLDNKDLLINIDCAEIIGPDDLVNNLNQQTKSGKKYPLYTINFLPFFSAADSQEEGYILVPDGTGALINFNNKKLNYRPYNEQVFGKDSSIMPAETDLESFTEQIYLPVFGMKRENNSFLAIIEEGQALANIYADVAGRNISYNTVFPEFYVNRKGTVTLSQTGYKSAEISLFKPDIYQKNIKVRYKFITGKKNDYVAMARVYQDYLVKKYNLNKIKTNQDIPFYLEVIGGITKQEPVLGIPRQVLKTMTSFEQTQTLIQELKKGGVNNIKLKYAGIMAGGMKHTYPEKFVWESQLGNREQFNQLIEYLNKNNISFYPEVNFLHVYQDKIGDGFKAGKQGSRYLNRDIARIFEYDVALGNRLNQNKPIYILSPNWLNPVMNKFLTDYKKTDLQGLAPGLMGSILHADMNRNSLVDRQQAMDIIISQLKKITEEHGYKLLFSEANSYVLPYTRDIINMPIGSSYYNIIDKGIPFYQLAIHGYINYAGDPVNMAQNYSKNLLKTLETGAYPYFKWVYQEPTIVKGTNYNDFYSVWYKPWLEKAREYYRKLNDLHDLQDKIIVDHQEVKENVFITTYENGQQVIVNYNKEPVSINNQQIPGEDFLLESGKENK